METKSAPKEPARITLLNRKLVGIHLPDALSGLRVLELGCGDGFFCREARRRGAAQVIGIDPDPKLVAEARKQATAAGHEIEFRQAGITDMPDGPFDFVLCLDGLHDVPAPDELLDRIKRVLSQSGTLIIEAGVIAGDGLEAGRVLYAGKERAFPTLRLLQEVWLKGYSFRVASPVSAAAGDPVTRKIYHCMREQVSVVMIHGDGGIGKSSLARRLEPAAVISTDSLFRPARASNATVAPAQAIIDAKVKEVRWLSKVWQEVRDNKLVRDYCATVIADAVRQCRGAGTVIVEGHVLADIGGEIEAKLGPDYRCWSMTRGAPALRPGAR